MNALGRRPERVALGSVFIGAAVVVGKLVVGLLTGSLGIISEAVHSLLDLAASVFTLVAVRTARKPADTEHPYGHGRAENLAAFAEGVLLLITAAGIAFEAVRRLMLGGAAVNAAGYAFVLLIATLLIEVGRGAVLRRVGRVAESDALQADATNRWSDVLATVGVLAGLAGVRMGFAWADSVAALLVAAIIARRGPSGVELGRHPDRSRAGGRRAKAARGDPRRQRRPRGALCPRATVGAEPHRRRQHRHCADAAAGGCRRSRR